ncbi:Hypothetical protein EAG7_00599 [Klebsiella aerogenes]|nr:Hypothetical protein EAG7_00599 [Klebsiella aerogenes]
MRNAGINEDLITRRNSPIHTVAIHGNDFNVRSWPVAK